MAPNLLDCLVSHKIIVDEAKAKMIDQSSRKAEQMKQQLDKLRKKGKYSDYRQMKNQLIKELKESDAIGLDLGTTTKYNNQIIKEVLAIYFDVLKNKSESPLLKSVFLGLPQFT
jgi:activator of 2-hydroxyglutaryl-CoA dehydratase